MSGTRSLLITPVRAAFLDALLVRARERFSELRRPLTWSGFRRAAERIGLTVALRPFPADAQALGYLLWSAGRWTVVIDEAQSDAARAVIGAHELAHHMAHRPEGLGDDDLIIYDRSPEWYGDVKEAEADYLAEQMIAGPEVVVSAPLPAKRRRGNNGRTTKRSAASNVPLATRKAPPPLPLPGWLEDVERDADAVRLKETAIAAAREDAKRSPATREEPTVRIVVPREQWAAIQLLPLSAAGPYPHYSNTYTAPHHEYVTCTVEAARGIVEQLARAGFKRTAVHVRRIMRETTRAE